MKRVMLFIATNLAVVLVLSVVLQLVYSAFNIDPQGMGSLLVFAAIFGFGGAFISLLMSKWMAKRAVGAWVIEQPTNQHERWLVDTVTKLARQAGIGMPEVAVYRSPDMNAFATGARRDNSLVAVSTGLLENMHSDEIEAVLAHEISHIKNGDMVTMTLLQGVLNTFVIFLARLIAQLIDGAMRDNQRGSGGLGMISYFVVVMVLEVVFGLIASVIVMAFSRYREYRADAGAATLVGSQPMVRALQRLKMSQESSLDGSLAAFGISGKRAWAEWFLSHPPLEKRIAALQHPAKR